MTALCWLLVASCWLPLAGRLGKKDAEAITTTTTVFASAVTVVGVRDLCLGALTSVTSIVACDCRKGHCEDTFITGKHKGKGRGNKHGQKTRARGKDKGKCQGEGEGEGESKDKCAGMGKGKGKGKGKGTRKAIAVAGAVAVAVARALTFLRPWL